MINVLKVGLVCDVPALALCHFCIQIFNFMLSRDEAVILAIVCYQANHVSDEVFKVNHQFITVYPHPLHSSR